jgi:hypothetical protein
MLNEEQLSQASPAFLRYNEAKYLLEQFRRHCGPPAHSYFHLIVYFDAFLFCIVSIEEMLSRSQKDALHQLEIFTFLKAARNITTHHSILAAPPDAQKVGFQRPFGRLLALGGPQESGRLQVNITVFRRVFDNAAAKYPRHKRGFDAGKDYLTAKETQGHTELFIEDIMHEALQAVADTLGYRP